MDIHIFWEGPIRLDDLGTFANDANRDYGVYQIYGHHPLYGSHVLLYIGLAQDQTFCQRISQENWNDRPDDRNTQVYIGRLGGRNKIDNDAWDKQILHAEKLLIYAHKPAMNTQNTRSLPEGELLEDRIYNWYSHRDLFPEVSGSRFTNRFGHIDRQHIYDAQRITE